MLKAFPAGANFLVVGKKIVGYLFFHPWFSGRAKELNNKSFSLTGKEDCLYLHDLAVLPEARGKGITKTALDYFDSVAKQLGFSQQFLVAVQGSKEFWESNGFSTIKEISYGNQTAYFMKKEI
jgi:GNAT superfamily N-acetyltransferase